MVWYVTREEVKSALDYKYTARGDDLVDRAIEAASRDAEAVTRRKFYPQLTTKYFNYPRNGFTSPWRIWLDNHEVISVTSLTAGGETISADNYFLEPVNSGPPYNRIEIDLGSSSSFSTTNGTYQQAIAITGLFGHSNEETYTGDLVAGVNSSDTTVVLPDTSLVGTGNVIRIEDERMIVKGREMMDSNQTLQAAVTSMKNVTQIAVNDGSVWYGGEVLLIDAERMLVTDVVDDTLIVERAWDGTLLEAHSSGATIYAESAYNVERGALGTTAASHASGVATQRWDVPGLLKEYTLASAINNMEQANSAYARKIEQESNAVTDRGQGVQGLREALIMQLGRKARIRGV